MSSLKQFFIHYSHFFTGQVVATLFGFMSFPIFTRILTQEEYGIMSFVGTTLALVVAFAKGGLSRGIIRFYGEYTDSDEQRTIFSSTIFFRGLILAFISMVLYILALIFMPTTLGLQKAYIPYLMIMALYVLIRPMNILVQNVLQIAGKTIFFNITLILEKGLPIVLSVVMVLYVVGQFSGYFMGLVLADIVICIILFSWFFSTHTVQVRKVSGKLARDLMGFGIPLLLSEISYLLLSYIDRYLILGFKGEGVLGVYSVGHNMAFYLSTIMTFPLASSIVPLYVTTYREEGREKTEQFLNKVVYYIVILLIPAWFGFHAVSNDIFIALASKKYELAATFSSIILLGSFCFGMNGIFSAGLFLQKKTKQISAILFVGFLANILANLLLIPKYSVVGSAIASVIGYVIVEILMIIFSYRYIAIKISWTHLFYYLILSLGMFLVVSQIETGSHFLNLMVKIIAGVTLIIPGVLYKEKEVLEKGLKIVQGLGLLSKKAS